MNDVACPTCGYDFPDGASEARRGFEYSTLADFALMIGGLIAGLSSVAALVASVIAIFQGQLWQGLVAGPAAFFSSLAMLVVFLRIQKI
jgi:hypothetical protein